jgi:hypothetical protein
VYKRRWADSFHRTMGKAAVGFAGAICVPGQEIFTWVF